MKRLILIIGIAIVLPVNHALAGKPEIDTINHPILIINAFDPLGNKSRKNKKELFTELADSLKIYLNNFLSGETEGKSIILPDLLKDTSSLNLQTIMDQHKAAMALVIISLDVYFEQTSVDVIRDNEGKKERKAYYDICCRVSYKVYRPGLATELPEEKNCRFFSTRTVVSGVLAAGPDVVGKKKYAYDMVKSNALQFLNRNGYLFD